MKKNTIIVESVIENSIADELGIIKGDKIISVNDIFQFSASLLL